MWCELRRMTRCHPVLAAHPHILWARSWSRRSCRFGRWRRTGIMDADSQLSLNPSDQLNRHFVSRPSLAQYCTSGRRRLLRPCSYLGDFCSLVSIDRALPVWSPSQLWLGILSRIFGKLLLLLSVLTQTFYSVCFLCDKWTHKGTSSFISVLLSYEIWTHSSMRWEFENSVSMNSYHFLQWFAN